ncbi:hypothetical protein BC832DRAFT_467929 [Gaertneriomyces semiglobifer]|nr:hypothetical protein BC832DRAFT_467929 [Gaertneriomyces semiglobifer]
MRTRTTVNRCQRRREQTNRLHFTLGIWCISRPSWLCSPGTSGGLLRSSKSNADGGPPNRLHFIIQFEGATHYIHSQTGLQAKDSKAKRSSYHDAYCSLQAQLMNAIFKTIAAVSPPIVILPASRATPSPSIHHSARRLMLRDSPLLVLN